MASKGVEPKILPQFGHIPLQDPVSLAYTVSDIVNIAISYYRITSDPGEKEYATRIIWNSINEWLEEVAPLRYIPGLVEELASMIKVKIWDADLDEKLLEEIIVDTVVFKNKVFNDTERKVLQGLADTLTAKIEELIEGLGGEIIVGTQTYDILYGNNEPSEKIQLLTTIAGIALVLATNT